MINKQQGMQAMWLLATAVLFVILSGCTGSGASISNQIISRQILGNADDQDPAHKPDTYAYPDLSAEDSSTKASSQAPTYNQLGGSVVAETANPGVPDLTGDIAEANSYNKVINRLVISKDGFYAFDINLNLSEIELIHDGEIDIQVVANVLDSNGFGLKDENGGSLGYITNTTLKIRRNNKGEVQAFVDDDKSPLYTITDGTYKPRISGPNGGIPLKPGNYQLEFDLRLTARAAIGWWHWPYP